MPEFVDQWIISKKKYRKVDKYHQTFSVNIETQPLLSINSPAAKWSIQHYLPVAHKYMGANILVSSLCFLAQLFIAKHPYK